MTAFPRVRRVYDEPQSADGARVLVDRVWPRGLRKDALKLDDWARDVAPSTGLRTWYGHDPAKFDEFRERYLDELSTPPQRAALDELRARAVAGPLTLLTATRDVVHSQAAVLATLLRPAAANSVEAGESVCYARLICPECGELHTPGELHPPPGKENP